MIVRTQQRTPPRCGAATIELAVVTPVAFLFLFGIIIGALGVFRYQEVGLLAREGARYASVHGANYAFNTGNPPATAADIQNLVKSQAVVLDPSQLTVTTAWNTDNRPGSLVTVTVNYVWVSELIFGSVTLSSSATLKMSY